MRLRSLLTLSLAAASLSSFLASASSAETNEEMRQWFLETDAHFKEEKKRGEAGDLDCLRKDPAISYTENAMGAMDDDEMDYTTALRCADTAIELKQFLPWAHVLRGRALINLGRVDEGLAEFRESIRLDVTHPELIAVRAMAFGDIGRHADAADDFSRAVALRPDNTTYLDLLAYNERLAGRFDASAAHFRAALAAGAGDETRLSLAETLLAAGKHAACVKELEPLEAKPAPPAGLHLTLSKCLKNAGSMAKALEAVDRGLSLNPKDMALLLQRTSILYELERWEDLVKTCDAALALPEAPVNCLPKRAFAKEKLGRDAEAMADIDEWIKYSTGPAPLVYRASVWEGRKEWPKAEADYTRAFELDPSRADILISRSGVRQKLGLLDGALADAQNAALRLPSESGPFMALGFTRALRGEYPEALKAFDRFMKIEPNVGFFRTVRASILRRLKRQADALAEVERAATMKDRIGDQELKTLLLWDQGRLAEASGFAKKAAGGKPRDCDAAFVKETFGMTADDLAVLRRTGLCKPAKEAVK